MRRTKTTKAMALMLSLVMITSVFVGNTLSRYVTSVNSTDSARVAVWGINGGEDTVMNLFSEDYIVAGKTIAASNTAGEKIMAPGTAGEAPFSIINFEQNVAPEVAYEVKISLDDSEIHEKIKNNPSVQWKLDNGAFGTWDELKTSILSLSGNAAGRHVYGPGEFATAFQGAQTHKIAWQWIMDNSNNVMDTEMGNLALTNDLNAIIKVSITAQQVDDLVTNANMLEGANQTVNLQDVQPLSFRSASDINNFERVEVNGEPIDEGTDYTKTEGSTIITLTETYLAKLTADRYVINIVSSDMTASTVFEVIDKEVENVYVPIVHNGIVPEGGTYYVGVTNSYVGTYDGATSILTVGQEFPSEVNEGDVYIYDGIEYRYNMMFDVADYNWYEDSSLNGWAAYAISNKNSYVLLDSINGKELKNISYVFYNKTSLLTAPKIPSSVTNMYGAFLGCENLTGTIEINANPTNYNNVLSGTKISNITGLTSLKKEIILASDSVYFDKYYVGVTSNRLGVYNGYSDVYISSIDEEFPEPQTGDVYVYGDYEYRYNMKVNESAYWITEDNLNGWGVKVLDDTKSEYGEILITIAGKNVVDMSYTFSNCTSLISAPVIPNTVIDMQGTFVGCASLVNAPVIPSSVVNIYGVFAYCNNLSGAVEINANPVMYFGALSGTEITEVSGETTLKDEILATRSDIF